MPHIDRGYVDPIRRLRSKVPAKFRENLDTYNLGTQILGAFQPLVDMERDVANTFRPYKSLKHFGKDLLQPMRGIGNAALGLLQLIYIPFYLLGNLLIMNISIAAIATKGDGFTKVLNNTKTTLVYASSWIINGVSKIIRGATQLAATPLSWIKMIARGLSMIENKGVQRLVDDRSVRRLLKQAEGVRNYSTLEAIHNALRVKYQDEPNPLTGDIKHLQVEYKRLPTKTPAGVDWIGFFQAACDERDKELAAISASRFGKKS